MKFSIRDGQNTVVFEGFNSANMPFTGGYLAVAWVDGEYENWILDKECPNALDELKRYYQYLDQHATITVYEEMP